MEHAIERVKARRPERTLPEERPKTASEEDDQSKGGFWSHSLPCVAIDVKEVMTKPWMACNDFAVTFDCDIM